MNFAKTITNIKFQNENSSVFMTDLERSWKSDIVKYFSFFDIQTGSASKMDVKWKIMGKFIKSWSISINGVEFDFYHVNKQSTVFFSLTMNTTHHFLNPSGWITFALLSFRFKQMFHWRKSAKNFSFLADVALVGSILTTPVFYSETTYASP